MSNHVDHPSSQKLSRRGKAAVTAVAALALAFGASLFALQACAENQPPPATPGTDPSAAPPASSTPPVPPPETPHPVT